MALCAQIPTKKKPENLALQSFRASSCKYLVSHWAKHRNRAIAIGIGKVGKLLMNVTKKVFYKKNY